MLAALTAGGSAPADKPLLSASASGFDFSGNVESLDLELRNGGKGSWRSSQVSTTAPWLELQPSNVDTNGLGVYRVAVERAGLSAGVYSAQITARSNINTLSTYA